jgi:hypothetical protein
MKLCIDESGDFIHASLHSTFLEPRNETLYYEWPYKLVQRQYMIRRHIILSYQGYHIIWQVLYVRKKSPL